MEDKILCQGPGYTIARVFSAESSVPYGAVTHADGDVNHGWMDLRDKPDRVVEVPEASKSEGLADLLRAIAHPSSKLMSGACECAAFDKGESVPRWLVGGFVTVMFKDEGLNVDAENLVMLAKRVLSGIEGSSTHHTGYEMIVEPLRSFFGRGDCHALTLKPMGYGPDEAQAWNAFDYAARAAASSIERYYRA